MKKKFRPRKSFGEKVESVLFKMCVLGVLFFGYSVFAKVTTPTVFPDNYDLIRNTAQDPYTNKAYAEEQVKDNLEFTEKQDNSNIELFKAQPNGNVEVNQVDGKTFMIIVVNPDGTTSTFERKEK